MSSSSRPVSPCASSILKTYVNTRIHGNPFTHRLSFFRASDLFDVRSMKLVDFLANFYHLPRPRWNNNTKIKLYSCSEATIMRKVFLSKLHVYVWIDLNGRDRLWRMQLHLEQQRGTFFCFMAWKKWATRFRCFQKSDRQITWIFLRRKKLASILLSRSCWHNMTRFDSLFTHKRAFTFARYIQMCNVCIQLYRILFSHKTHLIKRININKNRKAT